MSKCGQNWFYECNSPIVFRFSPTALYGMSNHVRRFCCKSPIWLGAGKCQARSKPKWGIRNAAYFPRRCQLVFPVLPAPDASRPRSACSAKLEADIMLQLGSSELYSFAFQLTALTTSKLNLLYQVYPSFNVDGINYKTIDYFDTSKGYKGKENMMEN